MNVDYFEESPFYSVISFHKVVQALQEIAKEDKVKYRAEYAKSLLKEVEKVPEIYTGITSKKTIYNNVELIQNLLADLFPTALKENEIKAVSLPFQNFNFNFTKRFQQIILDAGDSFEFNFRDFNADEFYIISCCMIMNVYYNENFDISRPLFYDIPDKNGIIKHYKVAYNADFIEIIPTEKAVPLTQEDIHLLKKNYDNIALWKEKFPNHSWLLKGFGILTLFDVTTDSSISNLKSKLIKAETEDSFLEIIQNSFQSIFKIPKLKVGLVFLNNELENLFEINSTLQITSSFSNHRVYENPVLKQQYKLFFEEVIKVKDFYCVADIDDLIARPEISLYAQFLKDNHIESFILAKLNKIESFQGFIEVMSDQKYALNTVNSNKLNNVLPFINDTIDRADNNIKNQFDAIIHREFTSIHPSVYWKFLSESRNYFQQMRNNSNYVFKAIEFENVFPLYGETDIQGSTYLRNVATIEDLNDQLTELINMFDYVKTQSSNLLFEQRFSELSYLKLNLKELYDSNSEFKIQSYIVDNIHPVLDKLLEYEKTSKMIDSYYHKLDDSQLKYYQSRKIYDQTISLVNKNLANVIDDSQNRMQQIFPHYFERFRTDGVEHNAYIGASISPRLIFDNLYLYNLRLWQIQIMCEMIRKHTDLQKEYQLEINLTSLILVYNSPINIRFRLDEKRFDVSSSSDVRYQVIKKRIDKAFVKNTNDRIVKAQHLTIVYLSDTDKAEYIKYLIFLKSKNLFIGEVEHLEIQDLQDITGLRALRVQINIKSDKDNTEFYSYSNLISSNTIT